MLEFNPLVYSSTNLSHTHWHLPNEALRRYLSKGFNFRPICVQGPRFGEDRETRHNVVSEERMMGVWGRGPAACVNLKRQPQKCGLSVPWIRFKRSNVQRSTLATSLGLSLLTAVTSWSSTFGLSYCGLNDHKNYPSHIITAATIRSNTLKHTCTPQVTMGVHSDTELHQEKTKRKRTGAYSPYHEYISSTPGSI